MKICILVLFSVVFLKTCNAQQTETILPKIENYTRGELEIKVAPFGLDSLISIGKVTANGAIHFNFPDTHLGTTDETQFYTTQKIGRAIGMHVCHDKLIEDQTEEVTALEVKNIFLYKYGQQVGALFSATQDEANRNEFSLGSKLSLVLSSGEGKFKATCTVYEDDTSGNGEVDKNNLRNKTSYNINLKKGWNFVEHKLVKTKELEDDRGKYKRRLIEEKLSIDKIPTTMNWYIDYWANDASLEIEQDLIVKTPITKSQYQDWLPTTLGELKRTDYEIGKKLERVPTLNNIELLFEKGTKNAKVTIVDCASNIQSAKMFTLMQEMANTIWKDKTDTGYRGILKLENTGVIVEYNDSEVKTLMSYTTNGRFLVKAEAENIKPEELWELLKTIEIENLIEK